MKDGGGARWQRVAGRRPDVLAPGEELLPLFPLAHQDEATASAARLWGGLVPVGRREEYLSARVDPRPRCAWPRPAGGARHRRSAGRRAPASSRGLTAVPDRGRRAWKDLIAPAIKAAGDISDHDASDDRRREAPRQRAQLNLQ